MTFGREDLLDTARRNPAFRGDTPLSESVETSFNLFFGNRTLWGMKGDITDEYQTYIDDLQARTGETFRNPYDAVPRTESGRIASTREWDAARARDEQGLLDRVKKLRQADPSIPLVTPDEIRKRVGRRREQRRQERAEAEAGESGFLSGAAAFLGATAAVVTDPPVFGSMLIGAPMATGILRGALIDAAIGGASEAVAQVGIQRGREQFGEQADIEEAILSVALATGGGAVLSAAIRGGVKGTRALVERSRRLPDEFRTSEVRSAEEYLDRQHAFEDASPLEATHAGRAEHEARLTEAQRALLEQRAARLTDTTQSAVIRPVDIPAAARQAVTRALGRDAVGRAAKQAEELGEAMATAAREAPEVPAVGRGVREDPQAAATGRQAATGARDTPDAPAAPERAGEAPETSAGATEIAALEAELRERLGDDARLTVEGDDGAARTLTVREMFDEFGRDEKSVAELADCIARAAT